MPYRARNRRKIPKSARYLTDGDRPHFSFGAKGKDVFLDKMRPVVLAARRKGARRPDDLSRRLNMAGHSTAIGAPWTPRLTKFLTTLLFEDKSRPEHSLWNRKRPTASRRSGPLPQRVKPASRHQPRNSPSAVERAIQNLPSMRLEATIGVQHNALRQMLKSEDFAHRAEMKRLIDAINDEWRRRRLSVNGIDDYFKWPSTDAPGGDGSLSSHDWPDEGLLRMMRYTVNRQDALPDELRRTILTRIFEGHLPPLISPEYMSEWGDPHSSSRLKKIATEIAAFTRNAKRRHNPAMRSAISAWEADLSFLYETFYVHRFHFAWPLTHL